MSTQIRRFRSLICYDLRCKTAQNHCDRSYLFKEFTSVIGQGTCNEVHNIDTEKITDSFFVNNQSNKISNIISMQVTCMCFHDKFRLIGYTRRQKRCGICTRVCHEKIIYEKCFKTGFF